MNARELGPAWTIEEFVGSLSPDFIERFIRLLRSHEALRDVTAARVMREVANDSARDQICSFLARIGEQEPSLHPATVAFGIECALATLRHIAREQSIDVVWTGPETSAVAVRKSAAVLLELINGATTDLVIMSFASFRIPDAFAALGRASERGVLMYFILESEEESSGRLRQYGALAFGELRGKAGVRYFCWPKEKRPAHALLHAKVVIADSNKALVTSANLTENAIDTNMELGILIKGGKVPSRIHDHVMSLIESGEFEQL